MGGASDILVVTNGTLPVSATDGLEVAVESSAAAAMDRLETTAYACVVTGPSLTDATALEFLETVKETYPNLPVILYDTSVEGLVGDAIAAGATDVVAVTDDGTALRDRIRVVLERERVGHPYERSAFFTQNPDPIIEVSFENSTPFIAAVNDAFVDVFGFARTDVIGANLTDVLVPESEHAGHRSIRDAAIDGESVDREVRRHTVSGPRDFRLRVVPIPGGAFAWYIDVTERNLYQRRLEGLNETGQRFISAKTTEDVLSVTLDAVRDVLSHQATAIWRYDPADDVLVPVTMDERIDQAAATEVIGAGTREMQVFRGGTTAVIEDYDAIDDAGRPDSTLGTVLIAPIGDYGQLHVGSPTPGSFDATDRELVEVLVQSAALALERVRFERALSELHAVTRELLQTSSRDRIYELAVEASRELIELPLTHLYVVSEDGERLEPAKVTQEMTDRFGDLPSFDRGDGLLWEAYDAGETLLFDDVQANPSLHSGLPFRGAILSPIGEHGVLGSGSQVPAEFDVFDRELASLLAAATQIALDRADRVRALRDQETALRQQNERLDEFASIISHDLRNPLTVAKGHLELAQRTVDDDHLDIVGSALARMESMIADLLTLTREGKRVDDLEPVVLADVVEACWRTVDTGDATLENTTAATVLADEGRLRHVFENLFRNANDHSEGPVTIRVGDLEDGFYIEDDGPGVPADQRERVFEVGYSTNPDGTGFGLGIASSIVTAHGWSIDLTESDTGGARFEIRGVTFA